MRQDMNAQIEIPEGVEIKLENNIISAKGPKGEVSRKIVSPKLTIAIKDNQVQISASKASKREKTMIGTFKSHIKNLIQGVTTGHLYKLKVCSTHFPMTAAVENNEFVVTNFMGEKVPRKFTIKQGITIKVEGTDITIESADKELAGQTAASIEQICKITNRDRRIFQDGIYMLIKSKKIQNE